MLDFVGQKKWDAWHGLEGFPQESAAMAYVYFASQLPGGQSAASSTKVDEPSEESGMKRGVSTFVNAEGFVVPRDSLFIFYVYLVRHTMPISF
jgi:hypothetical protein